MSIPPTRGEPRPPGSLEQRVDVETPEQVVFSYTVAGIGSRAAAALIDYAICVALFLALAFVVARIAGAMLRGADTPPQGWLVAIFLIGQLFIVWGYYVFFEGLGDGQTPGKRRLGLRVVQDGGYSVSFAASAVRNLVRIVDMQPGFTYGVGIVSAALSRSGKRVGDLVAGTFVVRERVVHLAAATTATEPGVAGVPAATAAMLDDDEFALLERFVGRRNALDPERRRALADQLATRFSDRLPEPGPTSLARLIRLYEHERTARARGVASRSDTGAAREQHAIVAHGAARWGAFARRLADAQRSGLGRMSEDEVGEFVAEYRELGTDLARLKTASRGRELDVLFYLGRLVGGAHNLLYRQRRLVAASVARYLFVSVPREIRRSWRPVLAAALLLFGPAAITYVAVRRNPALAAELLPAEMIERAQTALDRERRGGAYLPDEIAELRGAGLASLITANNVQIAFVAFAMGVTGGVGTAVALVFNGVAAMGAPLALFANTGALHLILAFVAPHGVLELTAICIAGGAGLLVGSAILLPGARTRGEALVVQGRRAIRLVAAATLFLLVAGTIEGFVSPLRLPAGAGYAFAIGSAIIVGAYVALGSRGAEHPAEDFGYSEARAFSSR